jgi:hypothetical protein
MFEETFVFNQGLSIAAGMGILGGAFRVRRTGHRNRKLHDGGDQRIRGALRNVFQLGERFVQRDAT